ncbi:MAG: hypothetical protein LBI42_15660 [Chitinispirillales bacterium]|nr:hypothetical protein [Chitinispirillales bacterium]
MLRKAKNCLGFGVEAIDGFIGNLSDIYFDDQEWAVRYFVVDIDSGSETQKVLISPLSVGKADWKKRSLPVSLTKKRIAASPRAEVDLPISKQYEIALRRYYEWPVYWGQVEFLDTPSVKKMDSPPKIPSDEDAADFQDTEPQTSEERYVEEDEEEEDAPMLSMPRESDDNEVAELEFANDEQEGTFSSTLRSFNELLGYRIESTTGEAGILSDLIIDDEDWGCRYLTIGPDFPQSGHDALLSLHWLRDIDWGMSRIHITISQTDLENSPPFDSNETVSRDYEKELFDYYDKIR